MGSLVNWKTSLLGLVVGALTVAVGYYQPGMSWRTWALGAAVAIWGAVMKDFNVTGGTQPATVEAVARTAPAAAAPVNK
jgi:hypothetical protein